MSAITTGERCVSASECGSGYENKIISLMCLLSAYSILVN